MKAIVLAAAFTVALAAPAGADCKPKKAAASAGTMAMRKISMTPVGAW
jgi:hypothetical protein